MALIRYHFAQSQEVPRFPRINCLCCSFQRTVSEDRVIDSAASDAQRRGYFRGSEIFLFAETQELKSAPDIAEKQHRLFAADAIRADWQVNVPMGMNDPLYIFWVFLWIGPEADRQTRTTALYGLISEVRSRVSCRSESSQSAWLILPPPERAL
jgi:hypothetical protein